jgi:F-type H+-transporting ATPase subunit b
MSASCRFARAFASGGHVLVAPPQERPDAMPVHLIFAHAKLFATADVLVDFDLTVIAQFLLFATFVVVLNPLLFEPLMRVFDEREKRTEGAKAEARQMDARAGELLSKYEAELETVRRSAAAEREKLRAETAKLEAQIMAEARAESARILEEGKAKIAAGVADLRKELGAQQPALAAQIASRVLGREVAS